ncbi:MAG: hypothetical protein OXC41_00340 [Gammaproteobacteria bacterium]|nr:hypothetical protein [Gammaproteobacteria bacterium]
MRVFITGGGSACDVYRNSVEQSFRNIGTLPLFTTFPVLENAAGRMGQESFHRVSVAFGLSYDAESIGKIIPPQDIEDMPLWREEGLQVPRRHKARKRLYDHQQSRSSDSSSSSLSNRIRASLIMSSPTSRE